MGETAPELAEANARDGAHIRRACFLWEWLTGKNLSVEVVPTGAYVDALPDNEYLTAGRPTNNPKFRVRDNLSGTPDFCPLVRRSALPESPTLDELLDEADNALDRLTDPTLDARAVNYLCLSETRGSFGIEREKPSADKAERFVRSLAHAGEEKLVTENWLVELQNVIVRDVFSQEASYRTKQNWLADGTQRVTFFSPPPEDLRRAMAGWERFVNEVDLCCPEPLVRAACAAFGFVYVHPFLDGNGRIHRLLIHHVLNGSRRLRGGAIVPVSAVIARRNAHALIPPRKNALAWKSTEAGAASRNEALRACQRLGRTIWKKWSGYHRRSLVETKMYCFKRLGERVMARTFERQVAELHVRVALLNRFTQLGRPQTVAVA